jgi:hypothetical protein
MLTTWLEIFYGKNPNSISYKMFESAKAAGWKTGGAASKMETNPQIQTNFCCFSVSEDRS